MQPDRKVKSFSLKATGGKRILNILACGQAILKKKRRRTEDAAPEDDVKRTKGQRLIMMSLNVLMKRRGAAAAKKEGSATEAIPRGRLAPTPKGPPPRERTSWTDEARTGLATPKNNNVFLPGPKIAAKEMPHRWLRGMRRIRRQCTS